MKKRTFWCIASGVLIASLSAFGQTVAVPNANATTLGGDNSGTLPTSPFSGENQIVIAASQLAALGPVNITGLNYRALPGTGAVNVTYSGTIFVGYAATTPVAINTLFANNIGAGYTQVATLSGVNLTDPGCASGPTPCAFGTNNFTFGTPYPYYPSNGNLLIDLKFSSIVSTGTGKWDVYDCGITCVENNIIGIPLGTTTGSNNMGGNVLQLTYTPIVSATPVPPSILLTLAGLACIGFFVGRRGMKHA